MERDLGTQLEWVAAVHHNTEHPHVHIAVRGVDEKGMPLRIPREYIRSGLRGRAEEIATDSLGYRSPADAQEAQRRETLQNRYTPLDRILQRSNDGSSSHFAVIANPNDASLSESAQTTPETPRRTTHAPPNNGPRADRRAARVARAGGF